MTARPRIYLAGPEVFLPDPQLTARAKKAVCDANGLEGVFPLDAETDLSGLEPRDAGLAIYRGNRALLDSCDGLIANLTPFRGPSADPGTILELGYMSGRGRPVFGYWNTQADFAERTRDWIGDTAARTDAAGMGVEDFGLIENLMVPGVLMDTAGGDPGCIVTRETPPDRRFTDLAAFEICVAAAARHFGLATA